MEKRKPIKRSSQLAPLSREHHEALLFAWKLRQGLKLDVPVNILRKFTLWYWKEHTKSHFFQEEKILLPCLPPQHPLAVQLVNEHAHIRELILGLDKDADRETFSILADLAEKHIRWEERTLFVFLEENLSPQQLDEIHEKLQAHPVVCGEWKDTFWVKK